MYRFAVVLALLFISGVSLQAHFAEDFLLESTWIESDPVSSPEYVAEEVRERLSEMPCLVDPRYDRVVEGYITGYMVRHRERAEKILGRTVMYFPLFEEYLRQHNMPDELKYLAVVESALNPKAVSRVGATGLWQFMEETGRSYGLTINSQVDERSDPVLSTLAAIEYLKKQYDRFGSWPLALAAYNCGPGNVRKAIRRSRSKNFWKLRRYLPRETRNYVPAFIAATYLCLHFEDHQMAPRLPELDFLLTEQIKVYEYLPFHRISQVTGLSLTQIEALNPSYQLGYIPTNRKGNYLVLPKRVMPAVTDYLKLKAADDIPRGVRWERVTTYPPVNYDPDEHYFPSIYIVQPGDNLEELAALFNCSTNALVAWNGLQSYELQPGQELTLFHPRKVMRFEARIENPFQNLATADFSIPLGKPTYDPQTVTLPMETNNRYLIYRTKGGETLRGVAILQQCTVEELVSHNPRIHPDEVLRAGVRVRVEKLD
jgi:membrane-bound lytic murein transglycosylase D